jgi:2-polyprenyl-6-methoxyphenol hydroxylase-like FAD-dependent oxidoreductase
MSTSTLSSKPRIAIIGGGPVSLTLANILQNNTIPFTLYEAHSHHRTQGGSLDLHPESGQLAIKEAGLWEPFLRHARPESDVLKLIDLMTGECVWDEGLYVDEQGEKGGIVGGAKQRPEIDRSKLVQILSDNIDHANIRFNAKLDKITPSAPDSHKHDLHFADGTVERAVDLVVGGDGAWSRVRTLLTDVTPQYSGISMLELWCNDVASNAWLSAYNGKGSCFAFGEGVAVGGQMQGDGSLRVYASIRCAEDALETSGIDFSDGAKAREQFLEKYMGGISEDAKRMVRESKDTLMQRVLYELPMDFRWTSQPGATLIGDAAHMMTPFGGAGVNTGMTDSLSLAREIIKAWKGEQGFEDVTRKYEKEMWPRADKSMQKTANGKKEHFSKDGARHMADMLRGFGVKGDPALVAMKEQGV